MALETATRFQCLSYTKTWVIRLFAVSIVCSLLLFTLATFGVAGLFIGSIISTVVVGAVLLWTVAEMVEDGLQSN